MSLVTVINLCLAFSGKELFHDVHLHVEFGERIGLVGPNGSGKTSLLRLLANETFPDRGEIRIKSGTRIGYLPQDISERLSGPLLRSVIDSIPGRVSIGKEIEALKTELKKSHAAEEQEKLAVKLAEMQNEMIHIDTTFPFHKAEKILLGLGFTMEDFQKPISSLSGGWKMRAALGTILYQVPDLLLLDEPTNYLDIPSVHWLEQFLADFKGAIILVCHDRDFLNKQIHRVISFEPGGGGVKSYKGNYDQFLIQRQEDIKIMEAKAKNQEQKIKEAQKFIERFRAKATKARQAQSKIKLVRKIELVKSHRKEKSIHFSFPEVSPSGRVVITLKGVSKSFNNKNLYNNINLTILRGERVVLIGPNGFGKTTLLRMIAGEIETDQGSILLGNNVNMSYYAQHHSEMLVPDNTILDEVHRVVPHESVGLVRGVCGLFLFSGDEVYKPIGVLSGGEKARVSLAKILVKPGNLLVMDEPTNHLDLISSEILTDALSDFGGTVLFVSHNQSFINRLATKIWDINNGEIIEYPGNLDEYYNHSEKIAGELIPVSSHKYEEKKNLTREKSNKRGGSKKSKRKKKAEERNYINSQLKPVVENISRLEDKIAHLERREKEISDLLVDPDFFKDKDNSLPLLNEYDRVKTELEDSLHQWEEHQTILERIKRDLDAETGLKPQV